MLYTKTNARIINYQNKLLIAVHIWDKPTTTQWVSVAQNFTLRKKENLLAHNF